MGCFYLSLLIHRFHRCLRLLCSSVPYVSIFSVRLSEFFGAKIILFIRIIVVSAYVFSIIN